MTEEFTIQCQSCGTSYNDLQEICPYCGKPQPNLTEEPHLPVEEYLADHYPDEDSSGYPEDTFPSDTHVSSSDNISLHEDGYITDENIETGDEYFVDDDVEDPFVEDDIFAIVGEDDEFDEVAEDDDELSRLDEVADLDDTFAEEFEPLDDELDNHLNDYDDDESNEYDEVEHDTVPRRFTWLRLLSGCLVTLVCFGLLYGGIGLLAVREGLQERVINSQIQSEEHYQKGQAYLANNEVELAIAEFEQALKLNPNLLKARQALREAQRIAQTQPTPTSQTRSVAIAGFLTQAETHMSEQNWADAIQTLWQVQGLDPDYQPEYVSELLYTAYYQQGLQLVAPKQLDEALAAFEQALIERPGDTQVLAEQAKISLYLEGIAVEPNDSQKAIELFDQLYQLDNNYLDVKKHLWQAYELLGDKLVNEQAWCEAEAHYTSANQLQPSQALQAKAENIAQRCQDDDRPLPTVTPTATPPPPTLEATSTSPTNTTTITETSTTNSGIIFFSAFNVDEARWEIVSVPASGGSPKVIVTQATMPAVSPDGRLLLYHTELRDTEGLHILNLHTSEDIRLTTVKEHILPHWGNNEQFVFTAQEASTGRWQVYQGFADGKSPPLILGDGRTPDWSDDGNTLAYQGADPDGNNPGIYLAPALTRLTTHESDRSPVFSPDGSQLAYMSTRSGNWDIYTISVAGSAPRQITSAPGNDALPTWSPDGTQLAYVSDADGSWAIYIIDVSSNTPTKVTEWDGSNRADWLLAQIWWAR